MSKNDSKAAKDFWAIMRRKNLVAAFNERGHSQATIDLIIEGRACWNCGSGSHTFCNR